MNPGTNLKVVIIYLRLYLLMFRSDLDLIYLKKYSTVLRSQCGGTVCSNYSVWDENLHKLLMFFRAFQNLFVKCHLIFGCNNNNCEKNVDMSILNLCQSVINVILIVLKDYAQLFFSNKKVLLLL